MGIATTCDISSMRYAPSGREGIYIISQPTDCLRSKQGGYIAFERKRESIEFERKRKYIAFERKRKYIAFATANISPNKTASVDTDAVLVKIIIH
ncbi:MAG: hypothetical protein IJY22_01890, partial [Clostridia bacterium]|nr:hypothetical protein [Clostridia bacterium]